MEITPIKSFPHQHLGFLERGKTYDVDDREARRLCALNLCNPGRAPEVKPLVRAVEPPRKAPGSVPPSSASPVAQASPQTTASASEPGKKKRGRPRKDAPSSATPATD